jgi:hypothetical protein
MWRLLVVTVALILLTTLSRRLAAAQVEIERPWSEIPSVVGHEVALVLPDGTSIRGKVLAVQADALAMDVKKTSDKRLHPKGRTTISRSSISVIELRQMRRFRIGRLVGGLAGWAGGVLLGYVIGGNAGHGEGAFASAGVGALVGGVGGAVLGGYAGGASDRRITLIKIIPEAPEYRLDQTQVEGEDAQVPALTQSEGR